jgi:hypothetical protein
MGDGGDRHQWDWSLGLGEGGERVSCIRVFLSGGTQGGGGDAVRRGRHGAEGVKARREDFLRIRFVLHLILFSSRDRDREIQTNYPT